MSKAVAEDTAGLLEGLMTTRAIRRYRDEPIPDDVLRDILFAAPRAPSGSNRQPFRFVVLTDSDKAAKAKQLIKKGAESIWNAKRKVDQYDERSGADGLRALSRDTACGDSHRRNGQLRGHVTGGHNHGWS